MFVFLWVGLGYVAALAVLQHILYTIFGEAAFLMVKVVGIAAAAAGVMALYRVLTQRISSLEQRLDRAEKQLDELRREKLDEKGSRGDVDQV